MRWTDDIRTLKDLAPAEKKVAAKVLYNMGWSSIKLEQWLGISNSTVRRYVAEPTPKEMEEFEKEFTRVLQAERSRGIALGIRRLNELIPREKKIEALVKALEFLEGRPGVSVMVNIKQEFKKEFEEFQTNQTK